MADLNDTELNVLAKAARINISPELLIEVGYSLHALLDALDQIDVSDLDRVEPLPIILPPSHSKLGVHTENRQSTDPKEEGYRCDWD